MHGGMMRTAALLMVASLTFVACGEGETAQEPETTTSTEFVPDTLPDELFADWFTPETGLGLRFPVDWLPDEEVENSYIGFSAPPVTGDTFLENFNVVVVDLPADVELGQYVIQDGQRLANSLEDYQITGGYQDTMAGAEATAVAFNTTSRGVEISVLRLLAIVNGKGIEFTFLASRDEFENFSPVVQQIIDSITLSE